MMMLSRDKRLQRVGVACMQKTRQAADFSHFLKVTNQNAPNNINTMMRPSGTPSSHKRTGTLSSYSMFEATTRNLHNRFLLLYGRSGNEQAFIS